MATRIALLGYPFKSSPTAVTFTVHPTSSIPGPSPICMLDSQCLSDIQGRFLKTTESRHHRCYILVTCGVSSDLGWETAREARIDGEGYEFPVERWLGETCRVGLGRARGRKPVVSLRESVFGHHKKIVCFHLFIL
jgi:hypothetical protein